MVGIFRIWRGFSSPDKRLNHTFFAIFICTFLHENADFRTFAAENQR